MYSETKLHIIQKQIVLVLYRMLQMHLNNYVCFRTEYEQRIDRKLNYYLLSVMKENIAHYTDHRKY